MTNKTHKELIDQAFCDGYEYAQREFTRWDDTDNLKRAKDSDILAEEKKRGPGIGGPLTSAAQGAVIGVGAGAVTGGILKGIGNRKAITSTVKSGVANPALTRSLLRGIKHTGIAGAVIGTTIGLGKGLKKYREKKQDVNFYNKRLGYAQRQALRRERADWKQNMTQREGYSY